MFLSSLTGNEISDVLNFVVVDQFNQTVNLNFSMLFFFFFNYIKILQRPVIASIQSNEDDIMSTVSDEFFKLEGYTTTMIMNGCLNHIHKFFNQILGQFTFEKLTVYGEIQQTYYLLIFSNLLPKCGIQMNLSLQNEKILPNSYFYSFPIVLKNCETGQVLRSYKNL